MLLQNLLYGANCINKPDGATRGNKANRASRARGGNNTWLIQKNCAPDTKIGLYIQGLIQNSITTSHFQLCS